MPPIMSACGRIADLTQTFRDFRLVPKTEVADAPSTELVEQSQASGTSRLAGMSAQKAQGLPVELCDAFVDSGMRAAFKN
jgi:hypothetical protein